MKDTFLIDNSKTQTSKTQATFTPELAQEILEKGNTRFVKGEPLHRNFEQQIQETTEGQHPFAVVLSCIDSRIPTEIIFDQGIGDLFNARIAGNFANPDILGSMEFACKLAGAKLIVVMGHTSCGAIKGACDRAELGQLTQMLEKLTPAVDGTATQPGEERNATNLNFVNKVALKNVELTIENIQTGSPVLREQIESGTIGIVGAMYDVKSGEVTFLNDAKES